MCCSGPGATFYEKKSPWGRGCWLLFPPLPVTPLPARPPPGPPAPRCRSPPSFPSDCPSDCPSESIWLLLSCLLPRVSDCGRSLLGSSVRTRPPRPFFPFSPLIASRCSIGLQLVYSAAHVSGSFPRGSLFVNSRARKSCGNSSAARANCAPTRSHPPHFCGSLAQAVVGLDFVDGGEDRPGDAVLDSRGLVDRQQEQRHAVEVQRRGGRVARVEDRFQRPCKDFFPSRNAGDRFLHRASSNQ